MIIQIYIYEEIRSGLAASIRDQLAAHPNALVEVHLNTPGGSTSEAMAIFNMLQPRQPTVYIDGVVASAGSFIAMAGKRIIAAANALLMIHNPWMAGVSGDANELRKLAQACDMHLEVLLKAYGRSGISRDRLTAMCDAETWMNAEEALQLGFVDEVAEPLRFAAHSPACFLGYLKTPQELLMPQTNPNPGNNSPAPGVDAMARLRERNAEIRAMSQPHMRTAGVPELVMSALADPNVTVQAFGQSVLAELARGREPLNGGAGVDTYGGGSRGDGRDLVAAASDMVAMRSGIRIDNPHAGVRDISSMSMVDIMRACVTRDGDRRGFESSSGGASLVKAAMSTSDFPAILENSLGKALRSGFATEPATYTAWTRKITVPDFKPQSRSILGSAPDLLPVAEGAEYKYGSLDEDKSLPYQVGKYGRMVALTWEALVNDDLGAFMRMTEAMGQAAARAEGDIVYNSFAENAGAGPTMQDGNPLFHASHNNIATGTFTTVTAEALGAARVRLRRQQAVGGGQLNLTPRYLLVAPELEQAAETLLAAAARSLVTGADNALVPAWLARLELVVEARLPATAFYLLTSAELIDTLERAWLQETNGPVITEEGKFESDVQRYKVKHVFAARWLDWRGAVKVPISG